MSSSKFNIASFVKGKVFIFLIFFGVLLNLFFMSIYPVFPDEITWRFLYSRFFIDNFEHFSYYKPCSISDDGFSIPFYLYPQFAILSIFSFFDNFISFRIFPLFSYISLLLFLLLFSFKKKIDPNIAWFIFLVFVLSTIGNSGAFWYAISRSEFIFNYFLFLIFYILFFRKVSFLWLLSIILVFSTLAIAHPKFIYFTPIVIYFCFLLPSKKIYKFGISFFVLIYIILIIPVNTQIMFENCKEALPVFYNWLSGFNANPLNLFTDIKYFFSELAIKTPIQLEMLLTRAPDQLIFGNRPGAELPQINQNFISLFFSQNIRIIYFIQLFIGFYFFLSYLYNFIYSFFKGIKNINHSKNILFFLYLAIFIIIFFDRTTNAYTVSFWLLSITFFNCISFLSNVLESNQRKFFIKLFSLNFLKYFKLYLLIIFLCNSLLIYIFYTKWILAKSNDAWIGMSSSSMYFSKKMKSELETDYSLNCSSDASLYLFDDHTYTTVFKGFNGKNITAVTYLMLPFYASISPITDAKNELDKFLDKNYSSVIFYGSCGFKPELPDSFIETHRNKYDMCCLKR